MPRRNVFLDTSFLIALENKDDANHQRARDLDTELLRQNALLSFHWGILYEIADGFARIGRRTRGAALLARFAQEEGYLCWPITQALLDEALQMYCARTDKEWGLTHCTSFVLMRREAITDALTADSHFRQAGFRALLLEPS